MTLTTYCTRRLIDMMMRQITVYGMLLHSSYKVCRRSVGVGFSNLRHRWKRFYSY